MMDITKDNYYSQAAALEYMSCSQYKAFCACEEQALAEIAGDWGDWSRESSTALLTGSYIDAYFEGTLEEFRAAHPEIFKRGGELKADYAQAENIIKRLERDPKFMRYMSGEKQVIMTGEIGGVPYKIKMDSYHEGKAIADLKIMRDFAPIWNERARRRQSFVRYWGYDTQGAIYQEIVRQNTGERLPFYIAAATKERYTDYDIFGVPQEWLDERLEEVRRLSPHFAELKRGEGEPKRCGRCGWCRETKTITYIKDARELENFYADND